jgi:hypothetical protein
MAKSGSQGGNVFLVVGVLFIAYLFLTRRLQRVVEVLREPAGGAATTDTQWHPPLALPPGVRVPTSGTPPFNPNAPGYRAVPWDGGTGAPPEKWGRYRN